MNNAEKIVEEVEKIIDKYQTSAVIVSIFTEGDDAAAAIKGDFGALAGTCCATAQKLLGECSDENNRMLFRATMLKALFSDPRDFHKMGETN